jgi:hypothetical protein
MTDRMKQVITAGGRIALPVGGLTEVEIKLISASKAVRSILAHRPRTLAWALTLRARDRPWNVRRRPMRTRKGRCPTGNIPHPPT